MADNAFHRLGSSRIAPPENVRDEGLDVAVVTRAVLAAPTTRRTSARVATPSRATSCRSGTARARTHQDDAALAPSRTSRTSTSIRAYHGPQVRTRRRAAATRSRSPSPATLRCRRSTRTSAPRPRQSLATPSRSSPCRAQVDAEEDRYDRSVAVEAHGRHREPLHAPGHVAQAAIADGLARAMSAGIASRSSRPAATASRPSHARPRAGVYGRQGLGADDFCDRQDSRGGSSYAIREPPRPRRHSLSTASARRMVSTSFGWLPARSLGTGSASASVRRARARRTSPPSGSPSTGGR